MFQMYTHQVRAICIRVLICKRAFYVSKTARRSSHQDAQWRNAREGTRAYIDIAQCVNQAAPVPHLKPVQPPLSMQAQPNIDVGQPDPTALYLQVCFYKSVLQQLTAYTRPHKRSLKEQHKYMKTSTQKRIVYTLSQSAAKQESNGSVKYTNDSMRYKIVYL